MPIPNQLPPFLISVIPMKEKSPTILNLLQQAKMFDWKSKLCFSAKEEAAASEWWCDPVVKRESKMRCWGEEMRGALSLSYWFRQEGTFSANCVLGPISFQEVSAVTSVEFTTFCMLHCLDGTIMRDERLKGFPADYVKTTRILPKQANKSLIWQKRVTVTLLLVYTAS